MSVDPKLVEIARLAEADEPCPGLHLTTSSHFVIGMPGPSSDFAGAVEQPMRNELWAQVQGSTRRKERQATYEDVVSQIERGWHRAVNVPEAHEPTVITVYQALFWAWGESAGLRLPAVRVRLDAVSAWWVGDGQQVKGQGGGGWFYGVSVPLG